MTDQVPVLDKGFVRLKDSMGTDLSVVNAARVSFGKESSWDGGEIVDWEPEECEDGSFSRCLNAVYSPKTLKDKDACLIRYLARNKHWTPFGHCTATFHIKMPIFVARQWMRSNVGIVYNEISRRYVDDTPEFYEPVTWRARPKDGIKQGSGEDLDLGTSQAMVLYDLATETYLDLLEQGVAPEQARIVLPLSTYTEFWQTASLAALARVCDLREHEHAQFEVREYAKAVSGLCEGLWPVSWGAMR